MIREAAPRTGRRFDTRTRRGELLLIAALFFPAACGGKDDPAPERAAVVNEWRLVWQDEFDGTSLDTTRWAAEQGNGFWSADSSAYVGGWGNEEQQCYTADSSNVAVREGQLLITARRETVRDRASRDSSASCAFTSARLKTRAHDGRALFAQQYGRFVFRAKLPEGQGLWPALWMLPLRDTYGTWAASGEIDVMEARGQVPNTVLGTLHYGSRWPNNVHTGMDFVLPDSGRISDFHDYAVEWEPGRVRWFVDDSLYQTQAFWWSSSVSDSTGGGIAPRNESELNGWPAPFDQPFYLVMNLAVGGRFLGNPDASTPFPSRLVVDWVRVYTRDEPPLQPRGIGRLPWDTVAR